MIIRMFFNIIAGGFLFVCQKRVEEQLCTRDRRFCSKDWLKLDKISLKIILKDFHIK